MAETINGYTVHTSNGSSKQQSSVTIRNAHGQICGRVRSDTGRLLARMRGDLHSTERAEMIDKLSRAGVPGEDILALLTPPGCTQK